MPFTKHNDPKLIEHLRREADVTRDLLRTLRHAIAQGHVEPPHALIKDLGSHAAELAEAIEHFTVRHDLMGPDGVVCESKEEGVLSFVTEEARRHPEFISRPVVHPGGVDEDAIYRDQLGFSEQEYKDLLTWKANWNVDQLDGERAFKEFRKVVIAELEAGRYKIKPGEVATSVGGIVGIAIDVVVFGAAAAVPVVAVASLVGSCTTGLAAMATIPEVRAKLWGRGAPLPPSTPREGPPGYDYRPPRR